jgi:PHD/YefM family antitoxin component YafN of YafNO toxin-antitoxin module
VYTWHWKGKNMITVSTKELRSNLRKYIILSAKEDVQITKRNEVVAILSAPNKANKKDLINLD